MKKLLEDDCYVDIGVVGVEENGRFYEPKMPLLPVTEKLSLCYRYDDSVCVPVRALLDTGNDITLVKPETVRRLNKELNFDIPQFRKTRFMGKNGWKYEPTYKLALVFPGGQVYSSEYGCISPVAENWDFEDMDVWVGQDIFNQLVVTFDGPGGGGKVTIVDPDR
jgi:hypothetical protein